MAKAALHDHAIAITELRVARCKVILVRFWAASQNSRRNRKWHVVAGIVSDFSAVKIGVLVQLASRDGTLNWRTGGTQVSVKIALPQRLEARLIVHVLAAAGKRRQDRQKQEGRAGFIRRGN